MSEGARAETRLDEEGRRFMEMERGRCRALDVDVAGGRFVCRIYDERPDVCRWLEPASSHCLDKIATVDPALLESDRDRP